MPSARSIPNLVPAHEATYDHDSLRVRTDPGTYYVNASTGDDGNDGLSSGSAFATITHALDTIPKDIRALATINVAAGTYDETLAIDQYDSTYGSGTIEINGPDAMTAQASYVIQEISTSHYGHYVRLNTAAPAYPNEQSGLICKFTDGDLADTIFFFDGSGTWVEVSVDLSGTTSRAFTVYKPAVVIRGADGGPPVRVNMPSDVVVSAYYNVTFTNCMLTPSNLDNPGVHIFRGSIKLDKCIVGDIQTRHKSSSFILNLSETGIIGGQVSDFTTDVTSHLSSYNSYYGSQITILSSIEFYDYGSLIRGRWTFYDDNNAECEGTIFFNPENVVSGSNNKLYLYDTIIDQTSGVGNVMNFNPAAQNNYLSISGDSFIYSACPGITCLGDDNTLEFSTGVELKPATPANDWITFGESSLEACKNVIILNGETYAAVALVTLGSNKGQINLSNAAAGVITTDSNTLNMIKNLNQPT